jgi:hypothetical protein
MSIYYRLAIAPLSNRYLHVRDDLSVLTVKLFVVGTKAIFRQTHRFIDGQGPPPPASSLEKLLMPSVLVLKAVFFCIMLLQRCAVSMNAKSRQMAVRHSRLKSKSLGSKSDGFAFRLFWRFRELLNDLENRFELSVVFLLHLC